MNKYFLPIALLSALGGPAMATTFMPPQPVPAAAPDAPAALPIAPVAGGKPPGLYVQVLDGMIIMTNSAGSQSFSAGQFGYIPSSTLPPVVLPTNPGLSFSPPPVFKSSSAGGAAGQPQSNGVSCIVR